MRRDGPRYKQELLDSSVAAAPCTSTFDRADIIEGCRCPISPDTNVQKYRAVLAQEGFNLIIARSGTEIPLPYDAITSFPCIDTKQILPGCAYEQVQYLAMG